MMTNNYDTEHSCTVLPYFLGCDSAISTFSPVGSLSSDGLRMGVCVCLCIYSTGIVRNKLICEYANVVHTPSSFRPHTHTHTLILIPFEDHEPTGLKVDIACDSSLQSRMYLLFDDWNAEVNLVDRMNDAEVAAIHRC